VRKIVLACAITATVAGATSATAAQLITGADIKDASVTGRDLKRESVPLNRLSEGTQKILRAGAAVDTRADSSQPGPKGDTGAAGAQGATGAQGLRGERGEKGDKGDRGPQGDEGEHGPGSGNWGMQARNTIGSPFAALRNGPITAGTSGGVRPPFGTGSLGIAVADTGANIEEKAAYGNEVDFAGDLVSGLTAVGFRVWTSGENAEPTTNMPSITFEIDPNLATSASNYSSLVFVPAANSPANQWSGYIDATTTGSWFMTGAAGTAIACSQANPACSFADIQTRLNDGGEAATIMTVGITKGRDHAWQGAVDGLRINGTVFDFEEHGVIELGA
jgi:hypothetical protein